MTKINEKNMEIYKKKKFENIKSKRKIKLTNRVYE